MKLWLTLAVSLSALALAPTALGDPPPNDNRDSAAPIPTFPATIAGTTVEATVERLDPQISSCGRIEGTSWYRIDQAPDGTVALSVQGAGVAPVIRVYDLVKNGLSQHVCDAAAAGATAQVAFGTKRGASYLVIVGRKPSTPDGVFTLDATLFLPPLNDARSQATPTGKLGTKIEGSTLGATTDDTDPDSCPIADGSVWYSVDTAAAARLVLRLHRAGDLDAAVAVVRRSRNAFDTVACATTNAKGDAGLAWDVQRGYSYLVAIGQRKGSSPGDFSFTVTPAPPRDHAPGSELRHGAAQGTLDPLGNVNDFYWMNLQAGRTYSIAFASKGCASVVLLSKRRELDRLSCNDYRTFTPGPDGGGRYIFEVEVSGRAGTTSYRLRVAPADASDVGIGIELPNLTTVHGSLAPAGIDVADVYHFDVATPSDVRLRLGKAARLDYDVVLLTDSGRRLGYSDRQLRLRLRPGHYVAAVRGAVGSADGPYTLSLVVRQVTQTSIAASGTQVSPGATVTFAATTSPAPDAGVVEVEIDRFDAIGGWQFAKLVKLPVPGGRVSWTPPAPGRWRAHARFLGTLRFSPSESGTVLIDVAKPLG